MASTNEGIMHIRTDRRLRLFCILTLVLALYACGDDTTSTIKVSPDVINILPTPYAPSGVTATAVDIDKININWLSATDNEGVIGYKIYRNGAFINNVGPTSFSDSDLTINTEYCYEISAFNANFNESTKSSLSCATTLETLDKTPPDAPEGLSATAVSTSQVNLSWSSATDNVGISHYRSYRSGTFLATAESAFATDNGLTANSVYCYTVTAVDIADNESAPSTEVCETTYQPDVTVPVDLYSTGQSKCYDQLGNEIACAGTGQDSEVASGTDWTSLRFADNGDGTITDNLTGLTWMADGNCIKTNYSSYDNDGVTADGAVSWQHALDFIANINSGQYPECGAGHSDWMLPNKNELESLVSSDASVLSVWLNALEFNNFVPDMYWTSTTDLWATEYAWVVDMSYSQVSNNLKLDSAYVLPLRASSFESSVLPQTGQSTCYDKNGMVISCVGSGQDGEIRSGTVWSEGVRFQDNGDGTITDTLSGLMWLQDSDCFTSSNWQQSLDTVANFNANPALYGCQNYSAGYTDWTLPNINQLQSIENSDVINNSIWLSSEGFLNTGYMFYWSSTTSLYSTDSAWGFYVFDGSSYFGPKLSSFYSTWPVRVVP
jgi:chitodextrinase